MKHQNSRGFTIVETMIVLAVSGALFAATALLMSGQQAKAQFKSSMTDIMSKIQKTINEADTGSYPSSGNFTCNAAPSGVVTLTPSVPQEQGTNESCVFMGRAIQFGIHGTDPEQYLVNSLVASRYFGGTSELRSTLLRTEPLAQGAVVNESQKGSMQYGTKVLWVKDSAGNNKSGFAAVIDPSQATADPVSGTVKSGVTTLSIIPLDGTVGQTEGQDFSRIRQTFFPASAAPDSIQICFVGGNNQSGLITIGKGSASSVEMTIFNNPSCT